MSVEVLAGPVINWNGFITFIKNAKGESPTRCLDKLGLKLDNPYSFLVALQHLKNEETVIDLDVLNLVSFVFGIHCTHIVADELGFAESYTNKIRIEVDRHTSIVILSSTIHDFKLLLPFCLSSNLSIETRKIYSDIFLIFKKTDFRVLWSNYNIEFNVDGTIILKEIV